MMASVFSTRSFESRLLADIVSVCGSNPFCRTRPTTLVIRVWVDPLNRRSRMNPGAVMPPLGGAPATPERARRAVPATSAHRIRRFLPMATPDRHTFPGGGLYRSVRSTAIGRGGVDDRGPGGVGQRARPHAHQPPQ